MFQTTNHTPWLCSRNHWCNSSTIPWWYTMIWSTQNMMIHPPWIGASKCLNSATASPLSLPSLGSCLAGIVQQLVTNEVNVTWDLRSNKPNQQYLLQSSNWTPSDLWGLWTARQFFWCEALSSSTLPAMPISHFTQWRGWNRCCWNSPCISWNQSQRCWRGLKVFQLHRRSLPPAASETRSKSNEGGTVFWCSCPDKKSESAESRNNLQRKWLYRHLKGS